MSFSAPSGGVFMGAMPIEQSNVVEQQRALRVLVADPATVRECHGRRPFALGHTLVSSGLFTISRMASVAERMIATGRENRFTLCEGGKETGAKLGDMRLVKPFAAAVAQLENSNSWLKLTDVGAFDPELDALYRELIQDVETLLDTPIAKDVTHARITVFMASPHVVTPYHIDHDHNFLCQITNEKVVWLWNPDDRENLSELEIERFYFGNTGAAQYRPDLQHHAQEFHLRPGDAVYHAPLAPHLVKNGPNVSVSVSIAFANAALDRRARIYQANRVLRLIGLKPPPPGRSRVLDKVRSGAIGMLNKRAPKNYDEAVFSGIKRLKAPLNVAQRLLNGSRARPH